MSVTDTRTVTFGDAFYGVMSNSVNPAYVPVVTPAKPTVLVHDPFCTRSLMMHAMVDLGCMIEQSA